MAQDIQIRKLLDALEQVVCLAEGKWFAFGNVAQKALSDYRAMQSRHAASGCVSGLMVTCRVDGVAASVDASVRADKR